MISPLGSGLSSSGTMLFPSGAILSAAFLMILTSTCSNRELSSFTSGRLSSISMRRVMWRSLHIPSMKRLQAKTRSLRLTREYVGSGIFTTSAKRVMKRLMEKQRSMQTRITSQMSSIPSSVVSACSTVSNVEVIPAVVLFTSWAIIRITFS